MNGKNVKRMFNKIWKEQIVKPSSKVGIFKPKQGFDLEEEEEDDDKCMKEWEAISDYIINGFKKAENKDFLLGDGLFKDDLMFHQWRRATAMSDYELNPWAIFSQTLEHYNNKDYIGSLEPGIMAPEDEFDACLLIRLVYRSMKKQPNFFRVTPSDDFWKYQVGIDTRNIYNVPFRGTGMFGTSQFILTLELDEKNVMQSVIMWFSSFIYRIGKMFSDAYDRLDLESDEDFK